MTAAVLFKQVTKRFVKPGPSRRGWAARASEKAAESNNVNGTSKTGSTPYALMEENLALDRISFQVEEGEIFGLAGGSGAGKSTILRLVATLIQPDEGEVRVFGFHTARQPLQVQRQVNRVSVDASFYKQRSVLENLTQAARSAGHALNEAREKAESLLSEFGMDREMLEMPMEKMNGALLQVVTLTRALLARPRLLLLDDPARGMDGAARIIAMDLIRKWRLETGATVLITGQEADELASICDRIAHLRYGRMKPLDTIKSADLELPYALAFHPEIAKTN